MIHQCEGWQHTFVNSFRQSSTGWTFSHHLLHHTVQRRGNHCSVCFVLFCFFNPTKQRMSWSWDDLWCSERHKAALELQGQLCEPGSRHREGNLQPLG